MRVRLPVGAKWLPSISTGTLDSDGPGAGAANRSGSEVDAKLRSQNAARAKDARSTPRTSTAPCPKITPWPRTTGVDVAANEDGIDSPFPSWADTRLPTNTSALAFDVAVTDEESVPA